MPVNPWQHPYAALGATEFRDLKMTCLKITAAQLKVLAIGGGVKQETTVSIVYPKLHTCISLRFLNRQTEVPGRAHKQTLTVMLPASRGGVPLGTEKGGK